MKHILPIQTNIFSDFVALDFETANNQSTSACALGLIEVKNNRIVGKHYWLIQPPSLYFSPYNIAVHGITPNDVINQPDFAELWPEIFPLLDNKCVIAHNAAFDIRVLRATMSEYMLDFPLSKYLCTVQIARKTWPQLPNHKLNTMADYLGTYFHHHHALDDAMVCAQIAVDAMQKIGVNSLHELSEKLNIVIKTL